MITLDKLCYAYDNKRVLHDITLHIPRGSFTLIAGRSGSGKSTLLQLLKPHVSTGGMLSGTLRVDCEPHEIGIVFANPNTQLCCSTVLHELVFPMENVGTPQNIMARRTAEICAFLGISHLLHRNVEELSGGQKQLVNVAAALSLQPKLLVLDEPTAMLDPLAAADMLSLLVKLHREMGITIVVAEHNIAPYLPHIDTLAVLDGALRHCGTPRDVLHRIWHDRDAAYAELIPPLVRLGFGACDAYTPDIRSVCDAIPRTKPTEHTDYVNDHATHPESLLRLRDVTFFYDKHAQPILRHCDLNIRRGEILCIMGGNGSGKSTLLRLIGGILRPSMGSVHGKARVAYMPQNINAFFSHETVREELHAVSRSESVQSIQAICDTLGITHLLSVHPYDLSTGEKQRVAVAALLLKQPDLFILDEPTLATDIYGRITLGALLLSLGVTCVIATHDLEFAAHTADRCILLFDGAAALDEPPMPFFMGNSYYTTDTCKALRHVRLCDTYAASGVQPPTFAPYYRTRHG